MSLREILVIGLFALVAPVLFECSATAQAGAACSGTVCGLGGQIRYQIGYEVPLPISLAPSQGASSSHATVGPFTGITIQTAPFLPQDLPFVGRGLGQSGQLKPTPNATIMQTLDPGWGPPHLTMSPGIFHYGDSRSAAQAFTE